MVLQGHRAVISWSGNDFGLDNVWVWIHQRLDFLEIRSKLQNVWVCLGKWFESGLSMWLIRINFLVTFCWWSVICLRFENLLMRPWCVFLSYQNNLLNFFNVLLIHCDVSADKKTWNFKHNILYRDEITWSKLVMKA